MSIKTGYLVLYNLIQLIGNVCVVASIIRYNIDYGMKRHPSISRLPVAGTFDTGSRMVRVVLMLQWMEILHSLLRLSKGSPVASLIQVGFKSVIFFVFMDSDYADETVRNGQAAGLLLFVWSLADAIRYPFYLQQLLNADLYAIKWLRHSAWILLYPIGIALEAVVVYSSSPHIRATGRLKLDMPNILNFSIDPILLINMYLYVGVGMGSYSMLTYMWSQRRRALTPVAASDKQD